VSNLLKRLEGICFNQGQIEELIDWLVEEDLFGEVQEVVLTVGTRMQEIVAQEVVGEQQVYLRCRQEKIYSREGVGHGVVAALFTHGQLNSSFTWPINRLCLSFNFFESQDLVSESIENSLDRNKVIRISYDHVLKWTCSF